MFEGLQMGVLAIYHWHAKWYRHTHTVAKCEIIILDALILNFLICPAIVPLRLPSPRVILAWFM